MGYSGKCMQCEEKTSNPKFCSRSCSAKFNNKRPDVNRRTVEGSCGVCGVPIRSQLKFCVEHRNTRNPLHLRFDKTLDKTLNSNAGSNSELRAMARIVYRKSGRPLACAICGYDTHVDICHIKDIRAYVHGTSYGVINDQANLIALCRNHHWEFDHDILLETLQGIEPW